LRLSWLACAADSLMIGEIAMNGFANEESCYRRGGGEGGSFQFDLVAPPLADGAGNHGNFLERFSSMNYFVLFFNGIKMLVIGLMIMIKKFPALKNHNFEAPRFV
jgi:hypothetical protein